MRFSLILFIVLMLVGCRSAAPSPSQAKTFMQTQGGVTLSVKAISSSDYNEEFERLALTKGFQPLEITINNESDTEIIYSQESMGVATATREEIENFMPKESRAASWSVGAFLIWPMIASVKEGASELPQQLEVIAEQVIPAKQKAKGVVFIPKADFQGEFYMTLLNPISEEIIGFNVEGI